MLDFISQNFALSQNLSKLSSSKISTKIKKNLYFFYIFFDLILCADLFDYSEIVAIVKMGAVIEKETALITHEIVLVVRPGRHAREAAFWISFM